MNKSAIAAYASTMELQKQAILTKAHNTYSEKEIHQIISNIDAYH